MDWLEDASPEDGFRSPPDLASERSLDLMRRALLQPGVLSAAETQELAASALAYLITSKDMGAPAAANT